MRIAAAALTLLVGLVPAQQEPAPVVTQQERNELRAAAFKAERERRYGAAADAFLQLHRAAPDRIDWVVSSGRCLGMSGRFAEAIDLLDVGRKRFVGDVRILSMLARTLLLQSEHEAGTLHPEVIWADAADLAEQALRIDPDHEDSLLLLAQARYLLGDHDEAVRQAREAVKRHPHRAGAHVLIGRIAIDRFQRLLSQFERDKPTGQAEADLVAKIHEQRTRAKDAFRKAAELDPSRAHPHVQLSRIAQLDGKTDEAHRHVLDALAIDPDTPVSHQLLTDGKTWQQRHQLYLELQQRFWTTTKLKSPEREKKRATLDFHCGTALLDGREFGDALAAFARALQDDPAAKNNHYYAFLAAYHLEKFDIAEHHAAAYAAHSAPAFADVLRNLTPERRVQTGAILQFLADRAWQQQRIGASRDLNHVTACLQDSADAWNNHAFLCRETERFEQAYASYQHAIEKEPASPQLWNDAAVVLQHHLPTEENLKKAREMYGKALQLAEQVLADGNSSEQARKLATEARDNARKNLADLDQGK